MGVVEILVGVVLLGIVLWDTFETIVLSKTVQRRFSLTSLYYTFTWKAWKFLVKRTSGELRQSVLVSFGPISLLMLIAMWATILIFGFALIECGMDLPHGKGLFDCIYFSGVTFFTLGYGDMVPTNGIGRFMSVFEAGTGLGFLAVVISYVPIMYSNFSRRETLIVMLDSKAGSNPSAGELLKRHGEGEAMEALIQLLKEWEVWAAQQLEAYLSYPVLSYYRSQHDDQSWLLSLTCILDTCSLITLEFEGEPAWAKPLKFQAKATFAMARHVIVDLAYILDIAPDEGHFERFTERDWELLQSELRRAGIPLVRGQRDLLFERKAMYEPYAIALARDMFFTLPTLVPIPDAVDNWQVSAWESPTHF